MTRAETLRALVLAAGLGERLRPLTDLLPKPLLPVLGSPLLERTLRRLAAAGVASVAVNLHHLGKQIADRIGEEVLGMGLTYWPEQELLGTLGPLGRLRTFFGGSDPVLLLNGDSLCRWPVDGVVRAHRAQDADATLLLSSLADPERFGGGVVVDGRGRILSFSGEGSGAATRRGVFAGFHAISPRLLSDVKAIPSDVVRDLYEPQLERGAVIRGVFTSRRWHDLGTPRRYLDGVLEESRALKRESSGGDAAGALADGGWTHEAAEVGPGAEVVESVLECGAVVESEATVEGSLVMPGARIGAGSRVRGSIVGPGVVLAADSRLDGLLLTQGGDTPVFTPL